MRRCPSRRLHPAFSLPLARLRFLLIDLDPDAIQAAEALARSWPRHALVDTLVAQASAFEFEEALQTAKRLGADGLGP